MEMAIDLFITFWQWTLFGVLVVIGSILNYVFDGLPRERVGFTYKDMPHMKPVPILTKEKGFWGAIWLWITSTRKWVITQDWHYVVNGKKLVIPAGFEFDGASVPKFLATFLSPVGVLLMGGLVHDYAYKYASLKGTQKKPVIYEYDQKAADELFRDICIEVNGFHLLNYLAYYSLRLVGFIAWNGHRKNDVNAVGKS
tara:strand:+ start:96 stop:689 length:594 start_codon:yes stop_codon:yes gene_type:complete